MRSLGQLVSESLLYGVALAASQLAPLLLWPIYTRTFAASELGVLTLSITILTLLSILATAGLDSAAHRWYWETSDEKDRYTTLSSWFWTQVVLGLLFAVFLSGAVWGLHQAGKLTGLEFQLYLMVAGLLPLRGVQLVMSNWFRMQRQPLAVLALNLALMLLTLGFTFYLLNQKRGLVGVLEAQVYANLLVILLGAPFVWRGFSPKGFSSLRLRQMLDYALPLLPAGLAGWVLSMSDRWLLNIYLSKEEVAIYQMSVMLAMAIGFPVAAFQQAWGPFALSTYQRSDAHFTYNLVARSYVAVLVLVTLLVGFFAADLASLVFSQKYRSAGSSVLFLSFAQVWVGLYYIAGLGCNIVKQTKPIALALFLGAGSQIVADLILLPWLGRDGAAIAALLAQIVMVGYLVQVSQRLYPIPYNLSWMSGILVAGFVLGLIGQYGFVELWQKVFLWLGMCLIVSLGTGIPKRQRVS